MCVRKKIGAPAFEAGGSLLLTLSPPKHLAAVKISAASVPR